MRKSLIAIAFSLLAAQVAAQTENSEANLQAQRALELLQLSESQSDQERLLTLREIVAILENIATDYPDSLPGQRLRNNEPLGPLDLSAFQAELKAAGMAVPETPQAWYTDVIRRPEDVIRAAHGSLVPHGPATHAGIDIALPCGSAIIAPRPGVVALVRQPRTVAADATESDAPPATPPAVAEATAPVVEPDATGAVLLAHDMGDGQSSWSLYLGLDQVAVSQGSEVLRDQPLGMLGRAHPGDDCILHFEARKPAFGAELHHPLWDGLAGMGDWRTDPLFDEAWHDPAAWLVSNELSLTGNEGPAIASFGPIDARPLFLPLLVRDGAETTLPAGSAQMITNARLAVRPDGLEVTFSKVRGAGQELKGTDRPATGTTTADYRLVLTLEPGAQGESPTVYEQIVRPNLTDYVKLPEDTVFLLPADIIRATRTMRLDLVTPSGEILPVGAGIPVYPGDADLLALIEEKDTVGGLASALWACIGPVHDQAIGYTIALIPGRDGSNTLFTARSTDLWNPAASPRRAETLKLLAEECLTAADAAIRRLPPGGIAFAVTDRPAP